MRGKNKAVKNRFFLLHAYILKRDKQKIYVARSTARELIKDYANLKDLDVLTLGASN